MAYPGRCPGSHEGGGNLTTMNGQSYFVEKWDMLIAHPPCTDLAVSGARYFAEKQKDGRQQKSIVFFMQMALANIEKVAVENPVCIMSSCYRKPDQIIQPWQFGHPHQKTTCLWLKNLPQLVPTEVLQKPNGGWENQSFGKDGTYGGFVDRDENGKILSWNDARTAKIRSRTYQGIARAMAEQWAGKCVMEG